MNSGDYFRGFTLNSLNKNYLRYSSNEDERFVQSNFESDKFEQNQILDLNLKKSNSVRPKYPNDSIELHFDIDKIDYWEQITRSVVPSLIFKPSSKPPKFQQTQNNVDYSEGQKDTLIHALTNLRLTQGYQKNKIKAEAPINFKKGYHHHFIKDLFNGTNIQIELKYIGKKARILNEEYEVSTNNINFFYYKYLVDSNIFNSLVPAARFFYNRDEINWKNLDEKMSEMFRKYKNKKEILKLRKDLKKYEFCDVIVGFKNGTNLGGDKLEEIFLEIKKSLSIYDIKVLSQTKNLMEVSASCKKNYKDILHETIRLEASIPAKSTIVFEVRWMTSSSFNIYSVKYCILKAFEMLKIRNFNFPLQFEQLTQFKNLEPHLILKKNGFEWLDSKKKLLKELRIAIIKDEKDEVVLLAYKWFIMFTITTHQIKIYDLSSLSWNSEIMEMKNDFLKKFDLIDATNYGKFKLLKMESQDEIGDIEEEAIKDFLFGDDNCNDLSELNLDQNEEQTNDKN